MIFTGKHVTSSVTFVYLLVSTCSSVHIQRAAMFVIISAYVAPDTFFATHSSDQSYRNLFFLSRTRCSTTRIYLAFPSDLKTRESKLAGFQVSRVRRSSEEQRDQHLHAHGVGTNGGADVHVTHCLKEVKGSRTDCKPLYESSCDPYRRARRAIAA